MLCNSYYLSPDSDLKSALSNQEIKAVFESGKGLLWTDITNLTEADKEQIQQQQKQYCVKFQHLGINAIVTWSGEKIIRLKSA